MSKQPETIYLKNYQIAPYLVDSLDLYFNLDDDETIVAALMTLRATGEKRELRLDGKELELVSLQIDGVDVPADLYVVDDEFLTLKDLPEKFELEVVTRIQPQLNTSLNGLYKSSGNFCTQCEAEGFRNITYYLDRPDVMTLFTTTIEGDKEKYPIMLSNGNPVDCGELDDGRHWVKWEDPFKKPCYLFALVAGQLECIEDRFTTMLGREVLLQIFVEAHNTDKCNHAMASLKRSMKWDEEVFGREYDLDIYMIVAVDDFNMGAMENKGLNVFNSKYVLARPDTATDTDFINIEAVIGHEYFHNWSGNRVTCRDWFQLSLKEGFTVFRDQEFTSDMFSRTVKRIDDVNRLRSYQFVEDAGPMAHPIRPASYVEINNFYTLTVYEKGAEVVRMIYSLLGKELFRKGCDLYFDRHDGQAVTTDDFVAAMATVSGIDLSQFKFWYSQAGTPVLDCDSSYDAAKKTFTLNIKQHCPPSPGQTEKQPYHIPFSMGLLGADGKEIRLRIKGEVLGENGMLELKYEQESFVFEDVDVEPIPSLLRQFSAPVKLNYDYSSEQLAFLMSHDLDGFNRWEAGQRLSLQLISKLIEQHQAGDDFCLDSLSDIYPLYSAGFLKLLQEQGSDLNFQAAALQLPSENYIGGNMAIVDPVAITEARSFLKQSLTKEHRGVMLALYQANVDDGEFSVDAKTVGRRAMKNTCLNYLCSLADNEVIILAVNQIEKAATMTDVMAAMNGLNDIDCPERETMINAFYDKWQGDALVVDKWLALQGVSHLPNTLDRVKDLMKHPAFNIRNPNKVRSLISAFVSANAYRFHEASGVGYEFIADRVIELDKINPQIAARMVTPLIQWRRYDVARQEKMKAQLQRILDLPDLSKDSYEVVSKGMA